jgi:hypothetical protein
MSTNVVHDIENHRYEIYLDEERVGLMDYTLNPGEIHLVHTEVNPEHHCSVPLVQKGLVPVTWSGLLTLGQLNILRPLNNPLRKLGLLAGPAT